jgi:hypothetical protein
MPSSNLLDTLIACVVVFLVLSLIVQSIQSGCKKLFKLKSRQIEESLVDLFQNAFEQQTVTVPKGWARVRNLPGLVLVMGDHPSTFATPDVKTLYDALHQGFTDIGRVASNGTLMFDSLAKNDFLKVLDKVPAGALLGQQPGAASPTLLDQIQAALQSALTKITALSNDSDALGQAVLGNAQAKARFDDIQVSLGPLLSDLEALQGGRAVAANVLLGDLARIVAARDALAKLIAAVQADLQAELAQAAPSDAAGAAALRLVANGMDRLAATLASLGQPLDSAMALLRGRRQNLEDWFDTIMQSFEERYARSMKTWAIVLSLAVAVVLNASVFDLYKNVSTDGALRAALVSEGQDRLQNAANANSVEDHGQVQATEESVRQDVESSLSQSEMFGFKPFWLAFGPWWERNRIHQENLTWGGWCGHWVGVGWNLLGRLIGWAAMALLLSVGAPFWEDTLESLFGVKNLLRRGSDTQNVEDASGGGQPRS